MKIQYHFLHASLLTLVVCGAYASDLSSQNPSDQIKVQVGGRVLNSQHCDLDVVVPNKEYTLRQSRVPNYGYYFEQGVDIKAWSDRTKLPDYESSSREFEFNFSCNFASSAYRLKLDTSQAVMPNTSGNSYRYLLLPEGATPTVGNKAGFVVMTSRQNTPIDMKALQSQGSINLGGFDTATECNQPAGQDSYCSTSFNVAAILVGANTGSLPSSTNEFVPASWISDTQYTLNLSMSVEFD